MSGSHTPSTEPAAQAEAGSKAPSSSPTPSSPEPLAAAAAVDTNLARKQPRGRRRRLLRRRRGARAPPEATSSQPPLPPEAPPTDPAAAVEEDNDGWQPIWDDTYQAYYFYNSHTNETTWTNPRVPEATTLPATAGVVVQGGDPPLPLEDEPDPNLTYNPAIHGDYDPTAPYAQVQNAGAQGADEYVARGAFNRFTGKFQPAASRRVPENYNDENKSRRQMEFYFDVDAAASTHDGRSLKAERQTRKLSRKEVREFQEKRKARKEEKRKAWLRD
ncbi:uncharacterized protein LAJ45_04716 [Morchella importuna]|uniref:uncharacterized protein n=1 Tax=Morchella importuna TaxID=1174673 RepID=UPI001E8D0ECF|nr:uncharacterized protein LAJ45_04716 [Morchella importuna]KAH8151015.1 hypothetical protein LAJ45_04716 [Morchella importuna]